MNIKKSIANVFLANCIELVTGIIIAFYIPMVVSVSDYSVIKTYTLAIGYIGALSFGFYDGLYIKYGGKTIDTISLPLIKEEKNTFLILQLFITIIALSIAIFSRDINFLLFSASILPINLCTFYKRIYQSLGEFTYLKSNMIVYSLAFLLLNLFLSLILKVHNPYAYCITTIVANGFVLVYNKLKSWKILYVSGKISFNWIILKLNVNTGYSILLANIAVNMIYGIDRVFIKIFMDSNNFAFYSFAVSMLNIIMVLVQSLAMTFYSYFASSNNLENIKKIKLFLIILGGMTSSCYFLLNPIVQYFLPQYKDSLQIIAISFASYPYVLAINAVFLNLFKIGKSNKLYIKAVLIMLAISTFMNGLFIYNISCQKIAIATTLSFIIWYIYCNFSFNNKYISKLEGVYLSLILILFLFLSQTVVWYWGIILYFICWLLLSLLFYKKNYNRFGGEIK